MRCFYRLIFLGNCSVSRKAQKGNRLTLYIFYRRAKRTIDHI